MSDRAERANVIVSDRRPLGKLRVVELSGRIAAAYCGRMLAGAGATVTVVQPPGGHPLRRRRPAPGVTPGGLWEFLSDGKDLAGAEDEAALVAAADVVLDDIGHQVGDRPGLIRATFSPFGLTGPWRDRPVTEFVLQAMCGSTGRRGLPGRPPVHAGGAPVEYAAGSYAAAAISCYRWSQQVPDAGVHLDCSLLEAGAGTMHAFVTLDATFRADKTRPPRTVQIPSIEPTSDGYVGLSTITAQQFTDFLTMIGRPDLAADHSLLIPEERQRRRDEVLGAIRAWTGTRTTAEVVDLAIAYRIPVAPIGNGRTLPTQDHFVARQVFRSLPSGAIAPRLPFSITENDPSPETSPRSRWSGADPSPESDLPLAGLRVADLTAFWAGPAATHLLAALGADVVKVENPDRPDGMRYTTVKPDGPDWLEWSAVFHGVNANKRSLGLDLRQPDDLDRFKEMIGWADVVIENFSPRVLDQLGLPTEVIRSINPEAVIVRMPAFGLDGPWRDRTGFAMTVEQASGLAWQTGYTDGPPMDVGGVCDPLCGMQAVVSLMEALRRRSVSGRGALVQVPLVEVALNLAAEQVVQYATDGALVARGSNSGPDGAPQGVYPARGDDHWVALSVRDDAEWESLCQLMNAPGRDRNADPADPDHLDRLIAAWTSTRAVQDVVGQLVAVGIPAAEVVVPGEVADNPQLRARGFFEPLQHPVVGNYEIPSLPFRIEGGRSRWYRTPPPTVAQHSASMEDAFRPDSWSPA